MKYLNWQAWLIAAALAGCGGADAANGGVDVGVEMALTSGAGASAGGAAPALVASDAQGGEVQIEHARAIVERIELYLPVGQAQVCESDPSDDSPHCDDSASNKRGSRDGSDSDDSSGDDDSTGDKITIRGPFVIDLVDGTATPSIDVRLPAGHYRRVDVRFSNDGHGKLDATDPLNGNTFVADGTFTPNGGDAMPFSVALDFNEEARFESAAGFDIGANAASEVLLKLDISSWFGALPIGECVSRGTLVVDEKAECHLEQDLKDAIKSSGRLEHR